MFIHSCIYLFIVNWLSTALYQLNVHKAVKGGLTGRLITSIEIKKTKEFAQAVGATRLHLKILTSCLI